MANQNVTQLPQQTSSADTSSLLYAVTGGSTDTGLPLSVLFTSPNLTGTPTVAGYLSITTAASTYATITNLNLKAPLLSPTLTTPSALASPARTDSSNLLATTFFVQDRLTSPPAIGSVTPAAGAFTSITGGLLALTETANLTNTLQIVNTAGNGANLKLIGNGASTPNKTIRVQNGNFQVLNNAYSSAILTVDDGGNLTATGAISASQTGGIIGTTTNNSANAGSVGEYQTAASLATPMTTATNINAVQITLTAGDWDVQGTMTLNPNVGTSITQLIAGISTTSITFATPNTGTRYKEVPASAIVGNNSQERATPMVRISVAASTIVYLVAEANFTASTCTVDGFIRARRVR